MTKLLAMMDDSKDRNDRDFIDISGKGIYNKVDLNKLSQYIQKWKELFASKTQIEKFDKSYDRWINNKNN